MIKGKINTTASDWANIEKQKLAEQAGVSSWEQIFKNQYDNAQKQYEQTAYKDISSAYANYLNNQLSLRAAEGLSLQRQDLLNKANESEFSSAYDKTMGDYASTMANVAENISDTQSKQEELLNKRGKYLRDRMADLVVMAYNNSYDENGNPIYQDLFDVTEDLENEKTIVGWSDKAMNMMYDRDDQGNYVLNDRGKQIMSSLIYGSDGNQFNKYIQDNYDADVYEEWLNDYAGTFQETLTGNIEYDPNQNYFDSATEEFRRESLANRTNLGSINVGGNDYDVNSILAGVDVSDKTLSDDELKDFTSKTKTRSLWDLSQLKDYPGKHRVDINRLEADKWNEMVKQGILKAGDTLTINYDDFISKLAKWDYNKDGLKNYLNKWAGIDKNSKNIGIVINSDGGILLYDINSNK